MTMLAAEAITTSLSLTTAPAPALAVASEPAKSGLSMGEALGNMLVGFGIVFLVLIFLCGVIFLFQYVGKLDKSSKKAPAKAPVKAAPAAVKAPAKPAGIGGEDPAVVAAILGAVARECGPNAIVTSIVRSK